MPATLAHVKPGDLITADLVNALMDKIKVLEEQVQELGGTQTTPSTPPNWDERFKANLKEYLAAEGYVTVTEIEALEKRVQALEGSQGTPYTPPDWDDLFEGYLVDYPKIVDLKTHVADFLQENNYVTSTSMQENFQETVNQQVQAAVNQQAPAAVKLQVEASMGQYIMKEDMAAYATVDELEAVGVKLRGI